MSPEEAAPASSFKSCRCGPREGSRNEKEKLLEDINNPATWCFCCHQGMMTAPAFVKGSQTGSMFIPSQDGMVKNIKSVERRVTSTRKNRVCLMHKTN